MTELNEKQKQYIADSHNKVSAKKIAKKLDIDQNTVEQEIRRITQLPKSKRFIFTLIMFIIPLLFLIGLEFILRAVNYGGDLDLVLKQEINGVSYCYLNKNVAKRFFFHQDIQIPNARTAVFKKEKSPNSYRIFCLGGSTTAGFPYEFNATFPSLLKDRLDALFPQKYIEVINVGISAINSYSVLDFTRELVKYEPDLFLIYMGHNEFYGALGIGSTQQIGRNRNWVLFYMQLQKVRLFNLLRQVIGSVGKKFQRSAGNQLQSQTLMAQAVKNKYIGLDSEEYRIAKDYFEKNLEEIIRTVKRSGAYVIVSTLVSNLADQEPFSQQFSTALKVSQKSDWQTFFNKGYPLEMSGNLQEAITQYKKAENIDPMPAMLQFRMGKCLQKLGNVEMAKEKYVLAKDFDLLRFRASSEFNKIIRRIGSINHVPVVEMEPVFAPYCQDQILDSNLFTDHLHPNFEGYFWMANAFCAAMTKNGYIVPIEQWNDLEKITDEELFRNAGVTDVDLEIANQRIRKLTSNWPFKKKVFLREKSGSDYDNLVENTVHDLFARKIGWNEAHYRLARYLTKRKDYESAAKEYQAVIKVTPSNYFPYLELGDLLMRRQKFAEAEANLKKGLSLSKNMPYAYGKLGMLYFFTQKPNLAVEYFEQAVEINKATKLFNNDELAGAYYIMAMAYGQLGTIAKN